MSKDKPEYSIPQTQPSQTADPFYALPHLPAARILVIDDDHEACALVAAVLHLCGAHVHTLTTGDEALAWLSQVTPENYPQVLICDLAMPLEDGYSILHQVRTLEAARDLTPTPALALTSLTRSEDRVQALKAGFQMYLTKPIEPVELALTIAILLNP